MTKSRETLLQVEDLRAWLGTGAAPVRAVDGVSFDIRRGETFALLGESGCGKSMTALSLMHLLPPSGRVVGGRALFGEQDLLRLSEVQMRQVRGNRIAMIFQEPMTSLNPVLTVGEQIAEVLRQHKGLRGPAARRRAIELLEAVNIPDAAQRYDEYPHQLSGGMKQRVMIANALAGEPDLLIADEPTTALDVTIQAQVLDLMRGLQRDTGMAIMLITHDLGVVAEMADRVAVMYAGHIVELASREQFFASPRHPYSQKLFASLPETHRRGEPLAIIEGAVPPLNREFSGCRFVDRCEHAWEACREVPPNWVGSPDGRGGGVRCHLEDPAFADRLPAQTRAGRTHRPRTGPGILGENSPLVEVRDLKVHFPIQKGLLKRTVGHVRAVDGVDLTLRAGRTVALVGESGSGKTTAGKALLQLLRPTAGSVQYRGEELTRLRGEALRRHRSDLQIIFQDPYASMNPRMTVAGILEEGMAAQGIARGAEARRARIDELLEQVGLPAAARERYPHEFSGGQRQRICIARTLAVEPKLIVCDEPTSALDVSVQAQILNLLKALQEDLGLCYLFITHNLTVVEYLAHEVAVMYLGRIVEYGSVEEVMGAPKHPYTQALLSAVPRVDKAGQREVIRLEGELPSPVNPPSGCHFHPRCPHAMEVCRRVYPADSSQSPTHRVKCHLYPADEHRDAPSGAAAVPAEN